MSTTPVATPSTTPSAGSSLPPNSDTSSLLFGFLVTALTIFAAFMTFAVVWNRLIARRQAIDDRLAMSPADSPRARRPMMWDIWIMPDKQAALSSLLGFKPVSAQIQCDCPSQTTETEQTSPFWKPRLLNRLPPEITYLFHPPIPPTTSASSDTDASQVNPPYESDIQLSLLITMPHALRSTRKGKETQPVLHEMALATIIIPNHDLGASS